MNNEHLACGEKLKAFRSFKSLLYRCNIWRKSYGLETDHCSLLIVHWSL